MTDNKFNPAYDNKIYQKYGVKTIENKIENKKAFCEEFGLPFEKKVPLICITYPLTDDNNLSMIQDIMNGILEQPVPTWSVLTLIPPLPRSIRAAPSRLILLRPGPSHAPLTTVVQATTTLISPRSSLR